LRLLEEKMSKLEGSVRKKGVQLSELTGNRSPGVLDNDISLELNDFIS
jgi:hypothetical protein